MVVKVAGASNSEIFFSSVRDDEDAAATLLLVERAELPFVIVEDVRRGAQRAIFPENRNCQGVVLIVGDLPCETKAALMLSARNKVWLARDLDAVLGALLPASDFD